MTAPQMRTPGASRASAETKTNPDILPPPQQDAAKRFARLAALYALQGWCLWRSDSADGPVVFHAARWGRATRPMRDLDQVEQLLQRIAGPGAC
jgi:hypothetical protein